MADPRTESSSEILILDRPCTYCQRLALNDAEQGGVVRPLPDGGLYVDFRHLAKIIDKRTGEPAVALDYSDYEIQREVELDLSYLRDDTLPDLPSIQHTALRGCAFCQILRRDILEA